MGTTVCFLVYGWKLDKEWLDDYTREKEFEWESQARIALEKKLPKGMEILWPIVKYDHGTWELMDCYIVVKKLGEAIDLEEFMELKDNVKLPKGFKTTNEDPQVHPVAWNTRTNQF